MKSIFRTVIAFILLLLPVSAALAQTPAPGPSPTGHWEGSIDLSGNALAIEVDLAKDAAGAMTGSFGQPAQNLRGLPLSDVKVDGQTVTFSLKAGAATSSFSGTVSEDGKTMTGTVTQAGRSLPFKATRTGEAKVTAAPKSPAIPKELEGTWNGILEAPNRQMQLTLKMSNQADGTSTGSISSADANGTELAIGIALKDKTLTIDVPTISGSFVGTLNADSTELAGTWTQPGGSLPLVFKKAVK